MRSGLLKGIDKHYEKSPSPKIILSVASLIISIAQLMISFTLRKLSIES